MKINHQFRAWLENDPPLKHIGSYNYHRKFYSKEEWPDAELWHWLTELKYVAIQQRKWLWRIRLDKTKEIEWLTNTHTS